MVRHSAALPMRRARQQDQINKINAMNINSCEAAQALVNGVVGEYDNSMMSGCANISQYLGSVSDRAEARFNCASNAPTVVKAAANSADPNVRNVTFVKGNVTWLALSQLGGGISQQEKELIMISADSLRPGSSDAQNPALDIGHRTRGRCQVRPQVPGKLPGPVGFTEP